MSAYDTSFGAKYLIHEISMKPFTYTICSEKSNK